MPAFMISGTVGTPSAKGHDCVQPWTIPRSTDEPRRPPMVTRAGDPDTSPGRPRRNDTSSVEVVPTPSAGVAGQLASCDAARASRNTYRPRSCDPCGRSWTQAGVSATSSQPSGTVNVRVGSNAWVA
jgi:hypothetical protein